MYVYQLIGYWIHLKFSIFGITHTTTQSVCVCSSSLALSSLSSLSAMSLLLYH